MGTVLATVLGLVGSWWWGFDLASHFRVQYLAVAVGCAAVSAAARWWRTVAAAGCVVLANAALIAPLWLSTPNPPDPDATPIELVLFNVHHNNRHLEDVRDYLVERDPDLIVALEATSAAVETLASSFPEHEPLAQPRDDAFGLLLLSRGPVLSKRVVDLQGIPAGELILEIDGQRLAVLAIHTMPPVGSANSRMRDAMLRDAAEWAKGQTGHTIMLGDFNATPWSSAFRLLLAETGLVNSQAGFGIQGSWPRQLWPLRIPIDHCLHSDGLTTVERSVGPFLGSDHRPVEVALVPRRAPP